MTSIETKRADRQQRRLQMLENSKEKRLAEAKELKAELFKIACRKTRSECTQMFTSKNITGCLNRWELWERYHGDAKTAKCPLCRINTISPGVTADGELANGGYSVGHDIAINKGGTNDPSNLRPICSNCNSRQGKKTFAEQTRRPLESALTDDGEEFIVERIISRRWSKSRQCNLYEVKWKGFKKTTYEPLAHINKCVALTAFMKLHKLTEADL